MKSKSDRKIQIVCLLSAYAIHRIKQTFIREKNQNEGIINGTFVEEITQKILEVHLTNCEELYSKTKYINRY